MQENRRSLYQYQKSRKERFKEQIIRLLGSRCEVCSNEPSRIEFRDLEHPFRPKYASNKVTLYRMILDGEFNSSNVKALCPECWIENRRVWKETK